MPFADIESSTQGSARFHYQMATPFETSATSLVSTLPTVLFLHGEYSGAHSFHPQFEDRQLRRFNLVALDMRAHGKTEGAVNDGYGQKDAAEDVVKFMEAINLQNCVLVGVSMGTTIGLQLAVDHPDKFDALFLVSPLGTEELEDVAQGRIEVRETWMEAFASFDIIDQSAIQDATFGGLQFTVNNISSPLVKGLMLLSVQYAMSRRRRTLGSPEDGYTIVRFVIERTSHSLEALSRIRCPIQLVHCLESVAYSLKYTEDLFDQLKQASVDVSLATVAAPQMGTITKPHIFNPMLVDFILRNTKSQEPSAAPEKVISPFAEALAQVGYYGDDESEE